MSYFNEYHFKDPTGRAASRALAAKGIVSPQPTHLITGTILFRLCHIEAERPVEGPPRHGREPPNHIGVCSPWWLPETSYSELLRRARSFTEDDEPEGSPPRSRQEVFRAYMREALAHIDDFGPGNLLVRASLHEPVRAWTGMGGLVTSEDGSRHAIGLYGISQYYIPGFKAPAAPGSSLLIETPDFRRVMPMVTTTPISGMTF